MVERASEGMVFVKRLFRLNEAEKKCVNKCDLLLLIVTICENNTSLTLVKKQSLLTL